MDKDVWRDIERRARADAVHRAAGLFVVFTAGGADEEEARVMVGEIAGALADTRRWRTWATLLRGMGHSENRLLDFLAQRHSSVSDFYRAVRESGIVPDDAILVAALREIDESPDSDEIPF